MAVSYKGLVIKFGGDTTELQSALKKVQQESRNTQSDLRDINKALKFDPGNTELLEQKVKALNSAYDETKQKLDVYKQALAQLESKKQSGAKLTAQEERQYDSLKRAIMQCERQLDSYGTELADTARQAEGSKTALGKLGQTIETTPTRFQTPVPRCRAQERHCLAASSALPVHLPALHLAKRKPYSRAGSWKPLG